MTVKPQTAVAKQQSSPEVAQKLLEIERQLIRKNQFVPALQALTQLLPDNLGDAQVWMLVGLVYTRIAHWQHAISALETAGNLDPENYQVKHLLSLALFSIGRKKEACELIDEVAKSPAADNAQWLLRAYIFGHYYNNPEIALKAARDWGERFADPVTKKAKKLYIKDKRKNKKLKIGYVSGDLREHSVAFFMLPVFENHDKDLFDIFVYSNSNEDAFSEEIKKHVPNWRNVVDLNDDQLYSQIRRDEIDILVDLSGYTHGQRLMVFARRAAPVQVTWLGYLMPLGMQAMDYRIASKSLAPIEHAAYYSEKLVNMSGSACYIPPAYAPLCTDLPLRRNGYPTLISLNSSGKITDEIMLIWSKILHKYENARLIIVVKEVDAELASVHMQPRVEKCGMPLDRVFVLPQLPLRNFMELGHIADVALDTSPISGGTTTLHTVWMGLPIVTMQADRGVDACTARMLSGKLKGCGEIANSAEEYIDAVGKLIQDEERLLKLRKVNREILQTTSIMNYGRVTRNIEKAFKCMWSNFLDGKTEYIDINKFQVK